MNVVLAPQGNPATLVIVPHPDYVEIIACAPLLDEPALLSAMEHLKLALDHHPRNAAVLEVTAANHAFHAGDFARRWHQVLASIRPLTKLAIIIGCADFDFSCLTHNRGVFLRVFANRRAAMRWFEQTIQLPVPRAARPGPIRSLVNSLFGMRGTIGLAPAGRKPDRRIARQPS